MSRLGFIGTVFAAVAGSCLWSGGVSVAQTSGVLDRGVSATAQGPLSATGTYSVARGDSLYGISQRFGLSVDALKSLNQLTGNTIVVGQSLVLSLGGGGASSATNATSLVPLTSATSNSATLTASNLLAPGASSAVDVAPNIATGGGSTGSQAVTYTVQRGDTAYRIATNHGISLAELGRLNDLNASYTLSVGQQLVIRPGAAPTSAATTSQVVASAATSSADQAQTIWAAPSGLPTARPSAMSGQTQTVASIAQPQQSQQSSVSQASASDGSDWTTNVPLTSQTVSYNGSPQIEPRGEETLMLPSRARGGGASDEFAWPLRGRVLSSYGPRSGGLINDGINIAARRGEPITAANSGKVIYASDEMDAFGNLVLIEHAGGYVSAYAHSERLLVRVGEQVSKGQQIAVAGSTGTVDRTQLHFEIRKDGKPINPLDVLTF